MPVFLCCLSSFVFLAEITVSLLILSVLESSPTVLHLAGAKESCLSSGLIPEFTKNGLTSLYYRDFVWYGMSLRLSGLENNCLMVFYMLMDKKTFVSTYYYYWTCRCRTHLFRKRGALTWARTHATTLLPTWGPSIDHSGRQRFTKSRLKHFY